MRHKKLLAILLLGFVLRALLAFPLVPGIYPVSPADGFDEIHSWNSVRYLFMNKSFQAFVSEEQDSGMGDFAPSSATQPPLYFFLNAVLFQLLYPFGHENSFYALRLVAILIGLAQIFATYKLSLVVFPARKNLALLSALFLAVHPTHVMVTAEVHNTGLALLVTTLLTYYLFKNVEKTVNQVKEHFVLGLAMGFGFLTRYTTLVGVPFIAFYHYFKEGKAGAAARAFIPATLIAFVIVFPHVAFNLNHYGRPLAAELRSNAVLRGESGYVVPSLADWSGIALKHAAHFWNYWSSTYNDYGFAPLYLALTFLGVLAAWGLYRGWQSCRKGPREKLLAWMALSGFALVTLRLLYEVLVGATFFVGRRYLDLGGILPILFFAGLSRLDWRRWGGRHAQTAVLAFLFAALLYLNVWRLTTPKPV